MFTREVIMYTNEYISINECNIPNLFVNKIIDLIIYFLHKVQYAVTYQRLL